MSAVVGDDLLLVMRRIDALLGEPSMPSLADDTLLAALQRIEDLLSGGGAGGTVTSVGLEGDGTAINTTVLNSPITGAGTMRLVLKKQDMNTVLAGALAGGGGTSTPTYRKLQLRDLTTVPQVKTTDFTIDSTLQSGQVYLCDSSLVSSALVPTLCNPAAVVAGWGVWIVVTDATKGVMPTVSSGMGIIFNGVAASSVTLDILGQTLYLFSNGVDTWYVGAYYSGH